MNDSLNNDEYEVQLEKFVYGGEAMGRLPDGRAVFVPYAMPGEKVRIRLSEEKRGFARGEPIEILSIAEARVEPACKHFTICGGCHYQHLSHDEQLAAKVDILREQLTRIGGIEDPPVHAAVASPNSHNYRNYVQFHIHSSGILGFQKWRSNEVVEIEECFLPDKALLELWQQLEMDAKSPVNRVGLRIGTDGEMMMILSGDSAKPPEMSIDIPVSVVYQGADKPHVLAGSPHLYIGILKRKFRVSAGSFFQVNNAIAEKMVEHVLEIMPGESDITLIDAYAGVGLFSAFIAPKVGQVIAIESSGAACDDFANNLDEFENVSLYQDEVEQTLPKIEEDIDIILVDPPRAGIGTKVVDAITQQHKPKMLIYISCDPATLSRDAKRLSKGGYSLRQVTPFDMFPQTYHIESISVFERA